MTAATDTTPRRRPLARIVLWTAAVLGVLFVLLVGAAIFVLTTEAGARLAWGSAQRALPGQLSGELAGGTMDGGLLLRDVVYAHQGLRIAVDRMEAKWEVQRSPWLLHVVFLRAGQVRLTLPPGDDKPPALPQRLTLPLQVRIDQASIETLRLQQDGEVKRFDKLRLQARSSGVVHTVVLEHAVTPYGQARAKLVLGGLAPFKLNGTALLINSASAQPYRVEVSVGGTLAAPDVRLLAQGDAASAQARIGLAPFAALPLRYLNAEVEGFNPKVLDPEWPQAALSIRMQLDAKGSGTAPGLWLGGNISLENALPGAFNTGRIPVSAASGQLHAGEQGSTLSKLQILLAGGGSLQGGGTIGLQGKGELALRARDLNLEVIHTALLPTRLYGTIAARLAEGSQTIEVVLSQKNLMLDAHVQVDAERFSVHHARLVQGGSRMQVEGTLGRDAGRRFSAKATLRDFDPAVLAAALQVAGLDRAALPQARINGHAVAEGSLAPKLTAKLTFDIEHSSYAGLPMFGSGRLTVAGEQLVSSKVFLNVAGNSLRVQGGFGAPSDKLVFAIEAPHLQRLGFGLRGALAGRGTVAGSIGAPAFDLALRGRDLAFGRYRAAVVGLQARAKGIFDGAPGAPVFLALQAEGLSSPFATIAQVSARVDGTRARHEFEANMVGTLRGEPVRLSLAAAGGLEQQPAGLAWRGTLLEARNNAPPRLVLAQPLQILLSPHRIEVGAGTLRLAEATVRLEQFVYTGASLRTAGSLSALNVGHLQALLRQWTGQDFPLATDLILEGRWNLALTKRGGDGSLLLQRVGGDLRTEAGIRLGVSALSLTGELDGARLELAAQLDTRQFGHASATGQVLLRFRPGAIAPLLSSPVNGTLRASIASLRTPLEILAGPRIAASGSAKAALEISGSLGEVRVTGTVSGEDLGMTLYDYGLRLRDGRVLLLLTPERLVIEQALFHAGGGTLQATGSIGLHGPVSGPAVFIVAKDLQILNGPKGSLTLSGTASTEYQGEELLVRGGFLVNRARLRMPDKAAPRLGDDVLVYRDGKLIDEEGFLPWNGRGGPLGARLRLSIALGDDFRFVGAGADMLLTGQLLVVSVPREPLKVNGTVRVVEGSYEAFGTELIIERGVISFQGQPTNPSINIQAYRRGQEVDAGVVVTGTVQRPRVEVVSEPEVAPAEQLSWLMFGRGGGAGGGQAAAQAAGVALLNRVFGGKIASGLGLGELGIGTASVAGLDGQVLNLGKELSDRLYVAFEQSIAGGGSVLMLSYELNRFWSAALYGGTVTGVQLSYSKRFDQLFQQRRTGAGSGRRQAQ